MRNASSPTEIAALTEDSSRPSDKTATGSIRVTNPRRIEWLPGPEDIVVDHAEKRAYVSSQIRRGGSRRHINGAIYELDLTQEEPIPRCLTSAIENRVGIFHPHGIDLFIDRTGDVQRRLLFVINHRTAEHHSIEIFQVNPTASWQERLEHIQSITSDAFLTSPNDLVAVAADEFYVVNDHGWRHKVYQGIETALLATTGIAMGSLVHVKLTDDNANCKKLANDIALPVGIEARPRTDPQWLFVASAWRKEIRIYERTNGASAPNWRHAKSISLTAAPDNLTWDDNDASGDLWVAAHPDLGEMMLYAAGLISRAPSCVLRVGNPIGTTPQIELVYNDDGKTHSASSVSTVYRSKAALAGTAPALLLIGSPWEEHVLACDLLESAGG